MAFLDRISPDSPISTCSGLGTHAHDRAALCVPLVAGSRRHKCGRCSRGGHPCEPDTAPPAFAVAVSTAAAGGQDVRPVY